MLDSGRPVIAWYDAINDELCFSYGSGTITGTTSAGAVGTSYVTTTTPQWQANTRVIPGSKSKGTHVDLVVDGSNNV